MYDLRSWLVIGTHQESQQRELLASNGIGAVLQMGHPIGQLSLPSFYIRVHDAAYLQPRQLEQGMAFIHDQRNWGRRILIADDNALSCAPMMAVAAIKEKGGGTLIDAYRSVLGVHPNAQPHPLLWDSVCDYYDDEPSYDVLWFHINLLMQQHAH
jgi:hypothetical protein